MVPGAHWPCNSMPDFSSAIVAAEPPAPSQFAARKPSWKGCLSTSSLTFLPASTKQGSVQSASFVALSIVSVPHSRSAR